MYLNHPETVPPNPQSMEKNCLPWNRSLVPKRLGTAALREVGWARRALWIGSPSILTPGLWHHRVSHVAWPCESHSDPQNRTERPTEEAETKAGSMEGGYEAKQPMIQVTGEIQPLLVGGSWGWAEAPTDSSIILMRCQGTGCLNLAASSSLETHFLESDVQGRFSFHADCGMLPVCCFCCKRSQNVSPLVGADGA